MKQIITRIDAFVDAHVRHKEEIKQGRLVFKGILCTIAFALSFLLVHVSIGWHAGIVIAVIETGSFLIALLLFWARLPVNFIANFFLGAGWATIALYIWYAGGLHSPVMPYIATTPLAALLLTDRRWTLVWTVASAGTATFFTILEVFHYRLPAGVPQAWAIYYKGNGMIWLVLLCLFLCLVFEGDLVRTNRKLDDERRKSDDLLRNILPEEVMQELKANGRTTARSYELVTVLFADFKDFTILSERLSPEELVSGIAEYFEAFDNLVDLHGAEKIKTVGDAYIAASGLPELNSDNPLIIVQLAVDMIATVEALREKRLTEGKEVFDIRIGVHTGPLVAGVVGIRKFAYDIWGDTVNTAARMQQHGEAGAINISQRTYELVQDAFTCSYRGKIAAKNKGEIAMYFVEAALDNKPVGAQKVLM